MPDNNSAPVVSMASKALGNPWAGFILALVVIILDQYTKMWASNELVYRVPVEITSWFDLMLAHNTGCLLYTSPSPRDLSTSRMPSSA